MRKKKTDKKIQPEERKSRAKYDCPTKLGQLIKDVNEINTKSVLPSWEVISLKKETEFLIKDGKVRLDDAFDEEIKQKTFDVVFPQLPDSLRKLLEKKVLDRFNAYCDESKKKNKNDEAAYDKAVLEFSRRDWLIHEYRTYENLRADLLQINRYMTKMRELGEPPSYMSKVKLPVLRDQTIIGKNNMWEDVPLGIKSFTKAIDLDRIRACEICGSIFWANYKNSFTCSTPCLNALRQRRHRKTNKEAINEKRRENYRIKKHLEKNKNGAL